MAGGTWIWIPDSEDDGSTFLVWIIIVLFLISFLYGLIYPDYEYYPADGSCDETESVYHCENEYFIYEKWLLSDKISGEIKCSYKRFNKYTSEYIPETITSNFEGRLDEDILIIELDSIGTIWNNGPTLEVKIIGDTLLRYKGREMVGGRTWLNFPGI